MCCGVQEAISACSEILLEVNLNSEWSLQNAKALGEGASGPRFPLVCAVSEALTLLFDLEVYSPWRLHLCFSDPDYEPYFDEFSLNFSHDQGMEDPEGPKDWNLVFI